MDKQRVYITGHRGIVGSAIIQYLDAKNDCVILTRTHAELDLTDQATVWVFFEIENVDQIYLAAAKVGGIHTNSTYPADFIYNNLMIESNIILGAQRAGVQKLLFLESLCMYPRFVPPPMLSHINVSTGRDCNIRGLAETSARVTGFSGQLVFGADKPDGTPRKLMDALRLKVLGWQASIGLEECLRETYALLVAKLDRSRI